MIRLLLSAAISVALFFTALVAADATIRVENPWARETPPVATTGAAYLTLRNLGQATDRLLGVSGVIAKRIELHTHQHEDGVMKMRQVEAVDVAPAVPVEFKPGGLHIMLIGLQMPLKQGERFALTLQFENAGNIPIEVVIKSITTQ